MTHPIDKRVGQRVRQARHMRALTQEQLAEHIGVKFQQLQKYETGMNRISASRLALIAEALNLPVSWFFGQDDRHDDILDDPVTLAALRGMLKLPERQKLSVLAMIEAMAQPEERAA